MRIKHYYYLYFYKLSSLLDRHAGLCINTTKHSSWILNSLNSAQEIRGTMCTVQSMQIYI